MSCGGGGGGQMMVLAFSPDEVDDWSELTMSRLNAARLSDFRISVMNDDDGGNDDADDDDDGDFDSLSNYSPIG